MRQRGKDIQKTMDKYPGDMITVTIQEADEEEKIL